ncbi:MAG: glutaminase A [Clostridia bacterium]|nr:glutaminase A [Clostridia bacterium]
MRPFTDTELKEYIKNAKKYCAKGKVATYIPALARKNKKDLGVFVMLESGEEYAAGDYKEKFSMQSVSKPFVLLLAMQDWGIEKVLEKVGLESTGDGFNSVVRLETADTHKPFNPMINAGAIAVTSMVKGKTVDERFERLLNFIRLIAESEDIHLNQEIYESELATGNRNRSLAYFMEGEGFLATPSQEALEVYFKQCSIEVTAKNLAQMGLFLARGGVLSDGTRVVSEEEARLVRSIIASCGLYDESGEFAAKVGIPAKSGVGGGIMCAIKPDMGIGIYGPALNAKGNSLAGIEVLKQLVKDHDLCIY